MEGYSGAVRRVMSESKKGALGGIHGTISQLITVDEKYAIAIETALGNAVQNIVTDSENDAKAAALAELWKGSMKGYDSGSEAWETYFPNHTQALSNKVFISTLVIYLKQ